MSRQQPQTLEEALAAGGQVVGGQQRSIPLMRSTGERVSRPQAGPQTLEEALAAGGERVSGADDSGTGFTNRAIAQTFGLPVDIVNAGLAKIGLGSERPFLGSESIASGMRAVGIPVASREPETLKEKMWAGAGDAASALLPFGAAMKGLSAARGTAGAVGQTMLRPFQSTPTKAVASEVAAGAGARAGMHAAEDYGPVAETAAGIVGGMAAGGLPYLSPIARAPELALRGTRAAARGSVSGVRRARDLLRQADDIPTAELLQDTSAVERSGRRLQGLAANPEEAARLAREAGISDLPAAYRTGDERLMALANRVAADDPPLAEALRQRVRQAEDQLRMEAQDLSGGDLEQMAVQATKRAEDRLSAVAPGRDAAESSLAYRQELDRSLSAARSRESELWNQIPRDAQIPTGNARSRFQQLIADLPEAQRDDMPLEASRLLRGALDPRPSPAMQPYAPPQPQRATGGAWEGSTTVREAHGLYSRLREIARNSRAGDTPNRNRARIADEIADAIWLDIESAGDVGPVFAQARDYSRQMNQTFRQGSVGKLLGYERTGDDRIAAELAFNRTLKRGGLEASVSADEMRRAVQFASESGAAADGAIQDYIRLRFAEHALTPEGNFRVNKGQEFLTKNRDLLAMFPELRTQINDAVQAAGVAERIHTLRQGFRRALESPSPRLAVNDLMSRVEGDPLGQAALKAGFVENAFRTGQSNDAGMPVLSGQRALAIVTNPRTRGAAEAILSSDEIHRMEQIARELQITAQAEGATSKMVTDVIGEEATLMNAIIERVAQVGGARLGAMLGRGGGAGTSLQSAQMGSSTLRKLAGRLGTDHGEELITRSILDDDLFSLLFAKVGTPEQAAQVESRLQSYLNSTALGIEDMLNSSLPGTAAGVAGRED